VHHLPRRDLLSSNLDQLHDVHRWEVRRRGIVVMLGLRGGDRGGCGRVHLLGLLRRKIQPGRRERHPYVYQLPGRPVPDLRGGLVLHLVPRGILLPTGLRGLRDEPVLRWPVLGGGRELVRGVCVGYLQPYGRVEQLCGLRRGVVLGRGVCQHGVRRLQRGLLPEHWRAKFVRELLDWPVLVVLGRGRMQRLCHGYLPVLGWQGVVHVMPSWLVLVCKSLGVHSVQRRLLRKLFGQVCLYRMQRRKVFGIVGRDILPVMRSRNLRVGRGLDSVFGLCSRHLHRDHRHSQLCVLSLWAIRHLFLQHCLLSMRGRPIPGNGGANVMRKLRRGKVLGSGRVFLPRLRARPVFCRRRHLVHDMFFRKIHEHNWTIFVLVVLRRKIFLRGERRVYVIGRSEELGRCLCVTLTVSLRNLNMLALRTGRGNLYAVSCGDLRFLHGHLCVR